MVRFTRLQWLCRLGWCAALAISVTGCCRTSGVVMNNSGGSFYQKGHYAMARNEYARAVYDDPMNPDYRYNLAMTHVKLGDPAQAEAILRHNLTIDAAHQPSYHGLAQLLSDQGREGEAYELVQTWVGTQPYHPGAHVEMAFVQKEMGDVGGAEQSLRQALSVDPNNPIAMANLGDLYRSRGQGQMAGQMYQQSLAMNWDGMPVQSQWASMNGMPLGMPVSAPTMASFNMPPASMSPAPMMSGPVMSNQMMSAPPMMAASPAPQTFSQPTAMNSFGTTAMADPVLGNMRGGRMPRQQTAAFAPANVTQPYSPAPVYGSPSVAMAMSAPSGFPSAPAATPMTVATSSPAMMSAPMPYSGPATMSPPPSVPGQGFYAASPTPSYPSNSQPVPSTPTVALQPTPEFSMPVPVQQPSVPANPVTLQTPVSSVDGGPLLPGSNGVPWQPVPSADPAHAVDNGPSMTTASLPVVEAH